jgi:hypothetical protein
MGFFDNTKSIVENMYLLSGPILAIFGFLIFYQIRLAKRSIEVSEKQIKQGQEHLKTNSLRDAATISAERVNFFICTILPLGNKLFDEKMALKFPEFKGEIKDFKSSELSEWDIDFQKSFLTQLVKNSEVIGLNLINYLEGFSVYFTKGIADEEIAFSSVGGYFCSYVEIYYPLIAFQRDENKANEPYCNIIELYRLWKSRLAKFESDVDILQREKLIEKQIEDLNKLKSTTAIINGITKPIGT